MGNTNLTNLSSTVPAPVMLDLEGKILSAEEREILRHPKVGGLILFTRNYESPEQLRQLIKDVRSVRPEILIAADQEGGRVQRFREGFTRLPPLGEFGKIYQENSVQAKQMAEQAALIMAKELRDVGIDFSFAPVLDVDIGISQVIGDRSFGANPAMVVDLAISYIQGLKKAGMIAVGKHFPGHGAVQADSHKELPLDKREFSSIWENDLLPYRELHNELAGVMAAHIIYEKIDKKPAGFSKIWLKDILRKKINFKGLIFSDDLNMNGAQYAGDFLARAKMALKAGCDMVLICNNRAGALHVLEKL